MQKIILLFSLIIALNVQARNEVDSLLAISSSTKEPDSTRLMALYIVAWDIYLYDQPDSAYYYGNKYLELAKKLKSKNDMANAYNTIGTSFWLKGEMLSALNYYEKSLALHKETNNKKGMSGVLNNMGLIFNSQGNYSKALEYLTKSLTLKESFGKKEAIATTLVNIGNIFLYQEDYTKALEYYTKALQYQKNTSDLKAKANTLNNIGLVYKNLGDFKTSMTYYQRNLALYNKIEDKSGIASSYINIGNLHKLLGNPKEAIPYFQHSLKLSQETNDKPNIANSYINLGAAYGKMSQYELALKNGYIALKLAEEIGSVRLIRDASEVLSQNEKKVGNFEKSLRHFEYYIKMRDSIQGEESKNEVLRQEFEYEYEKQNFADSIRSVEAEKASKAIIGAKDEQIKEKNRLIWILAIILSIVLILIAVLIITFRKLQKNKRKLLETIDEKETLLREIHHRVKNNLQVVSSLLNMHVRKVKDSASKKILEEGSERLLAMSIIHKNLYPHSDLKTISLDDYLFTLSNQLFENYQLNYSNVELETELEKISVDIDKLIPIGLIVNELISNSMKHAFNESSNAKIFVRLSSGEHENIELEISDNGKGIDPNLNFDKKDSIGMKLITIFSEKLKSKLSIINESGTKVTLSIPKN